MRTSCHERDRSKGREFTFDHRHLSSEAFVFWAIKSINLYTLQIPHHHWSFSFFSSLHFHHSFTSSCRFIQLMLHFDIYRSPRTTIRVMFICDVIAWEQFKCNWNKRNARDFVVVSLCSCSMFDLGFIICIFSRRAIVFYIRPCAIFVVEERYEGTRLFGVRCEMVDKKRVGAGKWKKQNLRMLFNSATLTAH